MYRAIVFGCLLQALSYDDGVRGVRTFEVLYFAFFATSLFQASSAAPPALTAEKWLNTLSIRPFDDRQVVVLFVGDKITRDYRKVVEELNKLARRSDVVVLAVTTEREPFARRFIEEFDPRFAVGIQSRSARALDVREFPTVLVFRRSERIKANIFELGETLGPAPASDGFPAERLSTSELVDRLPSIEDTDTLEESLSVLRLRMSVDDFMKLCDEIEYLKGPISLGWKGTVRYQRHLADLNIPVKQSDSSPGRDAIRKAKKEGTFPTQELHDLYRSKPEWTTEELLAPYLDHFGDSDTDLVYRLDWSALIGNLGTPPYADALAKMLDMEPDPTIRHRIAGAISDIYDNHPFQNPALLERLERRLEREDDIRWARPMLELVIYQLKNHTPE